MTTANIVVRFVVWLGTSSAVTFLWARLGADGVLCVLLWFVATCVIFNTGTQHA